ncbi:MAG: F0F1 ATP synthase subunit A [Candidatus Saccharimonadales bacterium]
MVSVFTRFAESAPTVHIAPGGLFTIHGYTITNSILYAWVTSVFLLIVFSLIARRVTMRPKGGMTQIVEIGTDFVTGTLENSLGDRQMALKYAPFFVTVFFFIAFTNLLGLLPGVGEALTYHGTPVFRAFTADLNGTLAAAALSMIVIQYFAIRESGLVRHLRHYFSGNLKNPLTYLAGIYEVLNEFIRVGSLALRLFLNIAIGEIIISVFSFLGKFAAPLTALPFVILELGVCVLQAYIFVMLSVTYLSLAVKHGEEHESEDSLPAQASEAK